MKRVSEDLWDVGAVKETSHFTYTIQKDELVNETLKSYKHLPYKISHKMVKDKLCIAIKYLEIPCLTKN